MSWGELSGPLRTGYREITGQSPDQPVVEQLLAYLALLHQWGQAFNLTSVLKPEDMLRRHVLDSLTVLPWVSSGPVLDAGTGAGLPGIPLAVCRPDLEFTLLDSNGKKVRFLRQVRRELHLANAEPVQERLEQYNPAEKPVVIVSRAFASLGDFARAARHLMGTQTRLLAMKGRVSQQELAGLPDWVKVESSIPLEVPGLHQQRHLVIMSTPEPQQFAPCASSP